MTEAICAHFSAAQKKYRNKSKKKELQTAGDKGNLGLKQFGLIRIYLDKSYFGGKK